MDSFLYPNFPNGSNHSDGLDKAIARVLPIHLYHVEKMAEKAGVRFVDVDWRWSALENHLRLGAGIFTISQDLEAEKSIES